MEVTIEAQDQHGNLNTAEQRAVTLLVAGNSITGAGLVDIVDGTGSISIATTVSQVATLSLLDSEATSLDTTSSVSAVFLAGATTQFVIRDPTDAIVGQQVVVTVEALDQFDNVALTEEADVELFLDGQFLAVSNVTGGSGITQFTSTVAETVTLTLANPDVAVDISSTQDVLFSAGEPPDC